MDTRSWLQFMETGDQLQFTEQGIDFGSRKQGIQFSSCKQSGHIWQHRETTNILAPQGRLPVLGQRRMRGVSSMLIIDASGGTLRYAGMTVDIKEGQNEQWGSMNEVQWMSQVGMIEVRWSRCNEWVRSEWTRFGEWGSMNETGWIMGGDRWGMRTGQMNQECCQAVGNEWTHTVCFWQNTALSMPSPPFLRQVPFELFTRRVHVSTARPCSAKSSFHGKSPLNSFSAKFPLYRVPPE